MATSSNVQPSTTKPPRSSTPNSTPTSRSVVVRVTVEVLLRTGLRVSEFTSLPADAVVQIGAAPWLHVPVGKLREDRYLLRYVPGGNRRDARHRSIRSRWQKPW